MTHAGLGGWLRHFRERAGLSVAFVAQALEVDQKTVYRWEREEFEPSIGALAHLAALYGVTVDHLVHGEPIALSRAG